MPCIHIRTRCYGKIKESMEDIHGRGRVYCSKCRSYTHSEEWTDTVPLGALIHFKGFTITKENLGIVDWFLQHSHQEVRRGPVKGKKLLGDNPQPKENVAS